MKTLKDFATACIPLTDEQGQGIYELLEFGISDDLRNEILKVAPIGSNEPFREAMIKLGYMFGVESLINY
jgi:hypothetical protein